jgi:hypothetical protein
MKAVYKTLVAFTLAQQVARVSATASDPFGYLSTAWNRAVASAAAATTETCSWLMSPWQRQGDNVAKVPARAPQAGAMQTKMPLESTHASHAGVLRIGPPFQSTHLDCQHRFQSFS